MESNKFKKITLFTVLFSNDKKTMSQNFIKSNQEKVKNRLEDLLNKVILQKPQIKKNGSSKKHKKNNKETHKKRH